ncbi:MAG: hypothetical protein R3D67_05100 [Hyphomicrobiaceae bacterium]
MSRTEYAAVLDNGPAQQNGFAPQHSPGAQGQQRRLRHALADLGPGRPLPPPTMPKRVSPPPPVGRPVAQAGGELAALHVQQVSQPAWSAEDVTHNFEAEDGPPPMLIERARTAQLSGVPAERANATPSYWPGLMVGFSMSLIIGAALYMALSGA